MIQEVDNSVFETGKKEQPVYPLVNQFKLNVKVSNVVPGNVEENMEKHISTIFVDKFQVEKKPLSKSLLTETAWTTEANEKEDLIFLSLFSNLNITFYIQLSWLINIIIAFVLLIVPANSVM